MKVGLNRWELLIEPGIDVVSFVSRETVHRIRTRTDGILEECTKREDELTRVKKVEVSVIERW